jgi:galactokinase
MVPQADKLFHETVTLFENTFREKPKICVTAPGRANLIGGHTDYNEGFVLPAAVDLFIVIAASPRRDRTLALFADEYSILCEFSLDSLEPGDEVFWANYITGVAFWLQRSGHSLRGANLFIAGDIPQSAGLGSSAALEMAAAYTFLSLNNLQHSDLDIIKLCQRVENEFVGLQCGIMDQFISCLGKQNHALYLDCRTLEHEYAPISDNTKLLVCHTGVQRQLAASEYNRRREECQLAVHRLATELKGIRALRDVSMEQFIQHQHLLAPTLRKRCRHVITENERVKQAVQALKRGDMAAFGSLMYQSHFSLKNDYEVSCDELDVVVDICAKCKGVYGARMTGAGFGGSAICLVNEEFANQVVSRLKSEYSNQFGREPEIYMCNLVNGVSVLKV